MYQSDRAIEDGFPNAQISDVAELESYRKEINRPIYYLHKWWARRLGSVFRAAILASALPPNADIMTAFYEPTDLEGLVVYDPFMGSGTTIGEAHKLGCTVLGRDINPVAYRAVKAALGPLDRREISRMFRALEEKIGKELLSLYRGYDSQGCPCDVLYYFWVKSIPCPFCAERVDLFNSYVFASNAYPKRHPEVQVLCPGCNSVFESHHECGKVTCPHCALIFDQDGGPARRTNASCTHCGRDFRISDAVGREGMPPEHRLYAKLVLRQDGEKEYLSITNDDVAKYDEASQRLHALNFRLARVPILPGHNTNQALNYGYRYWDEFFNDRQLLAITLLGRAIADLPKGRTRDAFACLFSGVLEFNNMFASYKGEGTGAVRHMFSHHIFKPERTPLEANIWGTPKSSGAFSNLYKSRLLRLLKYRERPFELVPDHRGKRKKSRKKYGVSPSLGGDIQDFNAPIKRDKSIHLTCGDSASTELPDGCVDIVVTDPPFFDNVHYSELADFFYVWQEQLFGESSNVDIARCDDLTTRRDGEVQDVKSEAFSSKLASVFSECLRVLRDDGILTFSYHHSRDEGWYALARAVLQAGFSFVQSQPVKSEMSGATPKSQARDPIDIDVFLVCCKRNRDTREEQSLDDALETALVATRSQVSEFNEYGRHLSKSDLRVLFTSHVLVSLSAGRSESEMVSAIERALAVSATHISRLFEAQVLLESPELQKVQAELFETV